MANVLLLRELEKEHYELVEIIRFERGRRYIYRLLSERDYLIHVVSLEDVIYVEFWHSHFAVPLIVFKITSTEELSRILTLLMSLTKVL